MQANIKQKTFIDIYDYCFMTINLGYISNLRLMIHYADSEKSS